MLLEAYRDALASRKPSPTHKGRGFDQLEGPEYRALAAIEGEVRYNKKLSTKQAKDLAITSLNQRKKRAAETVDPTIREEILKDYDEDLAALESMSPDDIVIGGRMYEVNIDAEPDELLDWFKPLDQQSDKVSKVLSDAFRSTVKDPDGVAVMGFDGEIVDRASNYSPRRMETCRKNLSQIGEQDFYKPRS